MAPENADARARRLRDAVLSRRGAAFPPQLAFVALIGLWIRAWRRDAGIGAKILVATLTLPYLAAATVRLWAPSAFEIFRNLNAS